MIDLKVSRELADAVMEAMYVSAFQADTKTYQQEMVIKALNNLTQALQNFGQELIREIKG